MLSKMSPKPILNTTTTQAGNQWRRHDHQYEGDHQCGDTSEEGLPVGDYYFQDTAYWKGVARSLYAMTES